MRVLALEPYYGGSHQAFLDGWIRHSRHDWTVLKHPPRKWKWRMRHAALTMRDMVAERVRAGDRWDALFCSDMLNLAEFIGLAPPGVRDLPRVVYFHENQLTYPFRFQTERDYHFGFTNMTTALAAEQVWFNSAFHREDFLTALREVLKRMPDYRPLDAPDRIRDRSTVQPPGIAPIPLDNNRTTGPLHVLWAARWEHDKNPDDFFTALEQLANAGVPFRLSVIGEKFDEVPDVFDTARQRFADQIERWGFQPSRTEYVAALHEAHVFVSTATHEFFGISAAEALLAGCRPVLPRRLAYPELLQLDDHPAHTGFFYDGTAADLATHLQHLVQRLAAGESIWPVAQPHAVELARRFEWPERAAAMDSQLAVLKEAGQPARARG